MDEEKWVKALYEVKQALDNADIEYWLDQGTLLGAVREGKFIQHDNDIDLDTWSNYADNVKIACRELRKKGFKIYFNEYEEFVRTEKEGCVIYVEWYHLKNDKAIKKWIVSVNSIGGFLKHFNWTPIPPLLGNEKKLNNRAPFLTKIFLRIVYSLPSLLKKRLLKIIWAINKKKIGCKYVTLSVPSDYFTNLQTIEFYGMKFKVPVRTKEYLRYRYGENWKTPKKDWKYWKDDGAISDEI